MTAFYDWCAFAGAWLLFAGPIHQAENELDAEAREAEGFAHLREQMPHPDDPSNWWWLLPPVAVAMHFVAARKARAEMRQLLTAKQLEMFVTFSQTATGWLLVAGGAGLIGLKETSSLCERYEWPMWIQWPLIAAMIWLSAGFTGIRARRRDEILGRGEGRRRHRRLQPGSEDAPSGPDVSGHA